MTLMKQGMQVEVELRVPLQKLWEALKNLNLLASKIAPNLTHQILEGDGGVGTVNLIQFGDGRYEKELVDMIDERTHTLVATVMTGGMDVKYNQYKKTVALSPARNGATTIACWRAEYAPVAESTPSGLSRDNALSFFKALESFLNTTRNPYA
ncbi:hypothetical protein MPTK1_3g25440 [Marchantia polymorpha subsp. ruderalis]|uniref:Bet v I/Major latex protein domain-containing protein n=2 Tax=Marchantia polymorpha TaxID=3197 RepID=A0A176W412_MARPO|nr:hypothetical protein AXG93_1669s1060 [Marchantia polymorpha subsp. ruderalis]PTQ32351.1 hypothetical protein MARPO_0100s0057 [Marchantia polymorpha]BBN06973.1 hypothetical protein Mp_3g25440 [Marchantia polymorpha subsp. ruderalis]|eukprot:PTQ32351.1 hypothetical protein MARPO_0100s0057 [Marchantia polymorpha]